MSRNVTFIDLILGGEASEDEVDDFVELWHTTKTGMPIERFLGMSYEEDGKWVKDPDFLTTIVESRIRERATSPIGPTG